MGLIVLNISPHPCTYKNGFFFPQTGNGVGDWGGGEQDWGISKLLLPRIDSAGNTLKLAFLVMF